MTWNEIAIMIIAIAVVIIATGIVYLLRNTGKLTKEAQKSLQTVTSDVHITLHHANELLAKTTLLVEDVTKEVATLDPLFEAAADLSVTVSDMNAAARNWTERAQHVKKAASMLAPLRMMTSFFKKNREEPEMED